MKKLMLFVLLMVLCGNLLVGAADGGDQVTLKEAVAAPGEHYYVMQGDQCVEVPVLQHGVYVLAEDMPNGQLVSIDRTKEKLIYVLESGNAGNGIRLYPVSTSYCCPIILSPLGEQWEVKYWDADDAAQKLQRIYSSYWPSKVKEEYRNEYVIASVLPQTIVLVEYEGTHYKQVEVVCDALYAKEGDGASERVQFQMTKDGYFILDISNIPVGVYRIESNDYKNGFLIHVVK